MKSTGCVWTWATDTQILEAIYVNSQSDSAGKSLSLSACFLAEGEMRKEDRSLFDKYGEPRDVCFDNKTGNECYWCRRCDGESCKAYIGGKSESDLPSKGSMKSKAGIATGVETTDKQ